MVHKVSFEELRNAEKIKKQQSRPELNILGKDEEV